MNDHPKITEDETRNAELVAAYDAATDTGPAFTDYIIGLGYDRPDRSGVLRWGLCVIYDDDGSEWLAWDAEEVAEPSVRSRV